MTPSRHGEIENRQTQLGYLCNKNKEIPNCEREGGPSSDSLLFHIIFAVASVVNIIIKTRIKNTASYFKFVVMAIVKVGVVHLCGLLCIVCISLFSQQNELWKIQLLAKKTSTTSPTVAAVTTNGSSSTTTTSSSSSNGHHLLNQINNHSTNFTTFSTLTTNPTSPQTIVVLYSKLRQDQSGWVILDMLKAHSYTYYQQNNMIYGGACGTSVHINDIKHVIHSIGLQHILKIIPQCPSTATATSSPSSVENRNTNNNNSTTTVSVVKSGSYYERGSKQRLQSTEWLNYMKQQINMVIPTNTTTTTTTKARTITVHIRRGDVTPCCYPDWYMPNKYFQLMIEHYVRTEFLEIEKHSNTTNNIAINIYSQSKSYESFDIFQQQMKESLLVMGRRSNNNNNNNNKNNVTVDVNVTVNIDLDGDIGSIWKSILSSDIIIPSRSEFSRVPSMFTNGKVISPWIKDITGAEDDGDDDDTTLIRQIHNASDIERTKIFNEQCTESMILRCKHKWWQTKK